MSFKLNDLPYDFTALEPHLSARTLDFHYNKHHQGYCSKLNELLDSTFSQYQGHTLEQIIVDSFQKPTNTPVFNNAAQVWNHTFYWQCMKKGGGGKPEGTLYQEIERTFGSFEKCAEALLANGTTQFGSGWAWLVKENGQLKVTKTPNAENPLCYQQTPILTCDVWEHAYYLDYQNRRPNYLETFLKDLVNWDFAQLQFEKTT